MFLMLFSYNDVWQFDFLTHSLKFPGSHDIAELKIWLLCVKKKKKMKAEKTGLLFYVDCTTNQSLYFFFTIIFVHKAQ